MTNFWLFPFGLIGYWFAVVIIEFFCSAKLTSVNVNTL